MLALAPIVAKSEGVLLSLTSFEIQDILRALHPNQIFQPSTMEGRTSRVLTRCLDSCRLFNVRGTRPSPLPRRFPAGAGQSVFRSVKEQDAKQRQLEI